MIGTRIREHWKRHGWSQETLGAMIGFSQSKISKIEISDLGSLCDLWLIATALGGPIEELISDHCEEQADDQ